MSYPLLIGEVEKFDVAQNSKKYPVSQAKKG